MSSFQTLDVIPIWGIYLLVVLIALAAAEVGYRIAQARRQHASNDTTSGVGTMLGSILALLAFMLAFQIGVATTRFSDRRQLLIDEANGVGTAYLRTDFLDPVLAEQSRGLLREYIDVRLAAIDPSQFTRGIARSEEIHSALWAAARSAVATNPDSVSVGLYIEALNEVIDLHTKRLMAVTNRVSLSVWLSISTMTCLSFAIVGFHNGLLSSRNTIALLALVLVYGAVITLLADLDRPGEGLMRLNPQALLDLQRQIRPPSP
ncbi:MAG: hypothetical protein HGA65_01010 [Oscillochloris sp.]|nr:hypothetical protein [Oscillochloris sp.]